MNTEKRLLKPAEAAAMLGVCTKTLNRWAKEGDVKHFLTRGGQRRYSIDDLKEFLERQMQVR